MRKLGLFAAVLVGLSAARAEDEGPRPTNNTSPSTVHAFSQSRWIEESATKPGEYFMRRDGASIRLGSDLQIIDFPWRTLAPAPVDVAKPGFFGSLESIAKSTAVGTKRAIEKNLFGKHPWGSEARRPALFAAMDPAESGRVRDLVMVRPDGDIRWLDFDVREGETLGLDVLDKVGAKQAGVGGFRWIANHGDIHGSEGFLSMQLPVFDQTTVPPTRVAFVNKTISSDLQWQFDEFVDDFSNIQFDRRTGKGTVVSRKGVRHFEGRPLGAPPEMTGAGGGGGGGGGGLVQDAGGGEKVATPRDTFEQYFSHNRDFMKAEPVLGVDPEFLKVLEDRITNPDGARGIVLYDDQDVLGIDAKNALFKRVAEGKVAGLPKDTPIASFSGSRIGASEGGKAYQGTSTARAEELVKFANQSKGPILMEIPDPSELLTTIGDNQSSPLKVLSPLFENGKIIPVTVQASDQKTKLQQLGLGEVLRGETVREITEDEIYQLVQNKFVKKAEAKLERNLLPELRKQGLSAAEIQRRMDEEIAKRAITPRDAGKMLVIAEQYTEGSPVKAALAFADYVADQAATQFGKTPTELTREQLQHIAYKKYNVPKWMWDPVTKAEQGKKYIEALSAVKGQPAFTEFYANRFARINAPSNGADLQLDIAFGTGGIGKTFGAEQLAEGLGRPYFRIDMNNYVRGSTASIDELKTMILNQFDREPYTFLHIDEIEKARPEALKVLYDVFASRTASGMVDTPTGKIMKRVVVSNGYSLATSNLGENFMQQAHDLGVIPTEHVMSNPTPIEEFGGQSFGKAARQAVLEDAGRLDDGLKAFFGSRVKNYIHYQPLDSDSLVDILRSKAKKLLKAKSRELSLSKKPEEITHLKLADDEGLMKAILEDFSRGDARGAQDELLGALGLAVNEMDMANKIPQVPGSVCDVPGAFVMKFLTNASKHEGSAHPGLPHMPPPTTPVPPPIAPPPMPAPTGGGAKRVFRRTIPEAKAPTPPVTLPAPTPELPNNVVPFRRK